jgi:hypothetical protein
MSWKPEVRVGSEAGFYGNSLRFGTKDEAERYAKDLMSRWFSVVESRATEVDDPVNHVLAADGRLVYTEEGKF